MSPDTVKKTGIVDRTIAEDVQIGTRLTADAVPRCYLDRERHIHSDPGERCFADTDGS